MPQYRWPIDPSKTILAFEARYHAPEAGALLSWAVSCVDALHYLADLDASYAAARSVAAPHHPDVVDVAHARWATGSSITALDLCAAAFGRAFCKHPGPQELDLSNFDPSATRKRQQQLRALLPGPALQWVAAVFADPAFGQIKSARDSLTHRRVARHLYASAGAPGPDRRLDLQVDHSKIPVGELVVRARDLAATHVSVLLQVLP